MEHYEHLTRAELVSLIRELKAVRAEDCCPAGGKPAEFQVFSEWHRREFDRSSWPMRIFEHGTFRFLAVNDAAVKLYGYSREEFLGMTAMQTRHPDELGDFLTTLDEPTGYFRHREPRRHIRKNGEIIVVEIVTQDILFDGRKARLSMNIDVTGRDRAQALLRRREQEFESLMAHSPDIVARLDRDFRHLYVNPAITAANGRPPAEIIGKTIAEVGLPPDLVARWDAVLRKAFATGAEQNLECEFEQPHGVRYYESRIVPELNADGTVETVFTITRDFTERKKAEELLWRREQEFERLAENIPDLVARFDRDRRYLYVNTAVEKALGVPRHEMLGKTLRELGMPEELAAKFERSLDEVFATGNVHTIEFSMNTLQGERFFDAHHAPEGGMQHPVETVLCVARDITERRQTAIAQSRLAAIVNSSADAIISKDLDGVIQTWNPGAERLFGYRAEEAVGRSIMLLIPPDRQPEEDLILERVLRGEQVDSFRSVRRRKDGTPVDVSLTISPLRNQAGEVIGASKTARDITERKLAELAVLRGAALTRLLEALARAANEAVTPEAAMAACLELICRHGRWALGRVAIYDECGTGEGTPPRPIWYTPDRERFSGFMEISGRGDYSKPGSFISRILRERVAVWMEDAQRVPGFARRTAAIEYGLRAGFAFPIIVRGDVAAIMEVFSEEARSQDPHIMEAAQSLASQLARLVEREEAHQANARMAAIVESSRDAIVSRRLDGTILTWNPGAERLFGYTAAEIVGRNVRTIFPPEHRHEVSARQAKIMSGQAASSHETVRLAKDGRRIQVSTSPAPIRDSSGEICGISTIIRDDTARKQAEQELRESEERFRQLAENIEQVFWINTPGFDNNLYVSLAYEKIWGRSQASLRADPNSWRESIHPDDRLRVGLCIAKATSGEQLDVEYRIVRPDGVERWIRDRSYPMKAGDGTSLVCGIAEDITEWKRAEQELREAQQRLQVAVQGGGVGLWDWDLVRNTVYFSPEWKRQLGYEDHQISNAYGEWEKRLHSDDRERVARTVQEFLDRPGSDYQAEYRLRHRDGSYRWILSRASAQVGSTGKVERMVGCHVEVTQQKQAAADQLEQAVSQRDALVREVHHRIKNSLQGVAGLLRQKIRKYPAVAPGLEEAIAQLQSVALVYGLQGARADGLLSLAEVTDAICTSAENLIGGRVERTFERHSLRSACLAGSEAVSVAVALNELVFNALKHQRAVAGKKRARVMLSETRSAAEIRISNRGRLPREFDFAAGRAVGNGLGLVRMLLAAPGGSIAFNGGRNEVEVVLKLSPPLLAERGKTATR